MFRAFMVIENTSFSSNKHSHAIYSKDLVFPTYIIVYISIKLKKIS